MRKVRELQERRQVMIDYLLLKAQESDWHGVADAAMDLRELEVELKIRREIAKPGHLLDGMVDDDIL